MTISRDPTSGLAYIWLFEGMHHDDAYSGYSHFQQTADAGVCIETVSVDDDGTLEWILVVLLGGQWIFQKSLREKILILLQFLHIRHRGDEILFKVHNGGLSVGLIVQQEEIGGPVLCRHFHFNKERWSKYNFF